MHFEHQLMQHKFTFTTPFSCFTCLRAFNLKPKHIHAERTIKKYKHPSDPMVQPIYLQPKKQQQHCQLIFLHCDGEEKKSHITE